MRNIICFFFLLAITSVIAQEKHTLPPDSFDSATIKSRLQTIKQVEIKGRLSDANIKAGSTGLNIDIKDIRLLPKLIGESDPYKALQYMGGVSQASEASAGLYVRGGSNDQNLILLNGTKIQNPTHVLGLFSVFNSDLISQMKFVKSGIPAEYGGRLSSVVDITGANSIPDKIKIDGSIGLISSRISTCIPLSNKLMVYGSYRGSYISKTIFPLLQAVGIDSTLTQNKYEFWDTNAGFVFLLTKRSRISGHFYSGKDILRVNQGGSAYNLNDNFSHWGNTAACIQYNQLFSDTWSMNQQISYSGFKLQSSINWLNSYNQLQSKITDISYKADFFHSVSTHIYKFGLEIQYNKIYPNFLKTDSVIPIETTSKTNNFFGSEASAYFRDEWTIGRWQFNYGLRTNIYTHLGPYTDYDEKANTYYGTNKIIKTYFGLEPRIYSRYLINKSSSVKLSVTRINQYLNQIPSLSVGIPTDIKIPASLHVKPQASWQFSGGYFKNFFDNSWETSCEIYYKTLENQLEFKNGITQTFLNDLIDQNLFNGKGWTYGSELTIRKNAEKLSGWLSYNLAWSYRKFDQINKGNPFLSQNDRRHDLSLALMYELSKKWSISTLFVYATGSRLNLPLSWYIINENVVWEYGKYNSFVMPSYHRLDISANYKIKHKNGIYSELNFSVYNVYNRANPFRVFYSPIPVGGKYNYVIKMSYLMPVIPSISWTFHI